MVLASRCVHNASTMLPKWSCVVFVYTLAALNSSQGEQKCEKRSRVAWHRARDSHEGSGLSNVELREIAGLSDMNHFQKVLKPILVPRVVGTESHAQVRKHLVDTMNGLGWAVEESPFESNTPLGRKLFTNVIATLNPDAPRHLVLACHYDSLIDREGVFVGATDSAVPCAMLLNLAKVLRTSLDNHRRTCVKKKSKKGKSKPKGVKKKNRCPKSGLRAFWKKHRDRLRSFVTKLEDDGQIPSRNDHVMEERGLYNREFVENVTTERQVRWKCLGKVMCCAMEGEPYNFTFVPHVQSDLSLQFLFFDGEEAFRRWSSTDSLYGSRNLAAKFEATPYPEVNNDDLNHLNRMDLFVLLDLLGTSDVTISSYFKNTDKWYARMHSYERRLDSLGLLNRRSFIFNGRARHNSGVEDDHIPFLKRGVPILHLIPLPFPSVWHKNSDNESALDYPTIKNLNIILRAFVADYLHLTL